MIARLRKWVHDRFRAWLRELLSAEFAELQRRAGSMEREATHDVVRAREYQLLDRHGRVAGLWFVADDGEPALQLDAPDGALVRLGFRSDGAPQVLLASSGQEYPGVLVEVLPNGLSAVLLSCGDGQVRASLAAGPDGLSLLTIQDEEGQVLFQAPAEPGAGPDWPAVFGGV